MNYILEFMKWGVVDMKKRKMRMKFRLPQKYDKVIHIAVLILILFGTFMLISIKSASLNGVGDIIKTFLKQCITIAIAYTVMLFFANKFSMKRAKRHFVWIGIVIFILLVATLFFPDQFGSRAWVRIPGVPMSIQPSEFVKVFMIVIMALYIEMVGKQRSSLWMIIRIPFIYFICCAVIILLQPDVGTLAVLTLITISCFLIPSHKSLRGMQKLAKVCLTLALCFGVFISTKAGSSMVQNLPVFSHITTRINIAINPFEQPHLGGYQLINGLYGIARGGLKGAGLGESIQKYGYLTQSDNDFILSIVIEEFGLFGLFVIVACYSAILYRLFFYAFKTKSEGYKIILIGTGMYIFIHFALNVGGVGGLIPLTGVPLLFISSGGSSLISVMCAIGISQSVISRIRRQGSVQTTMEKRKSLQN